MVKLKTESERMPGAMQWNYARRLEILIKITIKYSDCQLVESVTINHHVVKHQETKLVTGLCGAIEGTRFPEENQFCETRPWFNPVKYSIGMHHTQKSTRIAYTLPPIRHDLMSDKGKYHLEHLNA